MNESNSIQTIIQGALKHYSMPVWLEKASSPSNVFVLFIHGSYSRASFHVPADRAEFFNSERTLPFHRLSYRSSRRLEPEQEDPPFEHRIALFENKTVDGEWDDLQRVMRHLSRNCHAWTGFSLEHCQLVIAGSSLGGALGLLLSAEWSNVIGLVVAGTGAWLDEKPLPMLEHYPESAILLNAAAQFQGEFVQHCAEDDELFSFAASCALYDAISHDRKTFILHPKTDHAFMTVDGVLSEGPQEKTNQSIKRVALSALTSCA